jgi:hypothetical protein
MSRRMAVVRTDFSEDRIACIIRVERISELGTALPVPSNRSTLTFNIFIRLFLFYLDGRGDTFL